MFKNRKIVVTLDKKGDTPTTEQDVYDAKIFETKAEFIMRKVEGLCAKMFLGVCVYIVLDTHRQVAVARAMNS